MQSKHLDELRSQIDKDRQPWISMRSRVDGTGAVHCSAFAESTHRPAALCAVQSGMDWGVGQGGERNDELPTAS